MSRKSQEIKKVTKKKLLLKKKKKPKKKPKKLLKRSKSPNPRNQEGRRKKLKKDNSQSMSTSDLSKYVKDLKSRISQFSPREYPVYKKDYLPNKKHEPKLVKKDTQKGKTVNGIKITVTSQNEKKRLVLKNLPKTPEKGMNRNDTKSTPAPVIKVAPKSFDTKNSKKISFLKPSNHLLKNEKKKKRSKSIIIPESQRQTIQKMVKKQNEEIDISSKNGRSKSKKFFFNFLEKIRNKGVKKQKNYLISNEKNEFFEEFKRKEEKNVNENKIDIQESAELNENEKLKLKINKLTKMNSKLRNDNEILKKKNKELVSDIDEFKNITLIKNMNKMGKEMDVLYKINQDFIKKYEDFKKEQESSIESFKKQFEKMKKLQIEKENTFIHNLDLITYNEKDFNANIVEENGEIVKKQSLLVSISPQNKKKGVKRRSVSNNFSKKLMDASSIFKELKSIKKNTQEVENLLKEFLTTEKVYVANLDILNSIFIIPLNQFFNSKSSFQKDSTFCDCVKFMKQVDVIQRINKKFYENLSKIINIKSKSNKSNIIDFSKLILKYSEYFKGYVNFISRFPVYKELEIKLRKNKEEYNKFVNKQEELLKKESKYRIKNMSSYMILPVQRIARYKLFLDNIKKKIHPSSHSYLPISKAQDTLKKIAEYHNTKTDEQCNLKTAQKIKELFPKKLEDLITNNRKLLMEEKVMRKVKSGKIIENTIFLFSDSILILNFNFHSYNSKKINKKLVKFYRIHFVDNYDINTFNTKIKVFDEDMYIKYFDKNKNKQKKLNIIFKEELTAEEWNVKIKDINKNMK